MTEFERLKSRLKNINKNVFEYRMTVSEAKALVKEFEELRDKKEKPQEVVVNEPDVITRTIDGGAF